MQFQVPQFIEVEDKIIGPLTFRQFVFMGGGLGFAYLFYRVLPIYAAAPLIIIVVGFAAALAFFQYNGRPFIVALETGFYYLLRGKLYLWSHERKAKAAVAAAQQKPASSGVYVPTLSQSKLHELAWSLDINERIAAGTALQEERGLNSVVPLRTAAQASMRMRARAETPGQ